MPNWSVDPLTPRRPCGERRSDGQEGQCPAEGEESRADDHGPTEADAEGVWLGVGVAGEPDQHGQARDREQAGGPSR